MFTRNPPAAISDAVDLPPASRAQQFSIAIIYSHAINIEGVFMHLGQRGVTLEDGPHDLPGSKGDA